MRAIVTAIILAALGSLACAQPLEGAAPASEPTSQPDSALVRVDRTAGRVVVAAKVVSAEHPLEFLLCREGTKEYESLLSTAAEPSQVHAALLMLGLTSGKPARWSGQGESAVFLPPAGAELDIQLRWSDSRGEVRQVPAGHWLLAAAEGSPPSRWVFIGSDVLPDGVYWADLKSEGGLISVANLSSAVIDVPFASAQPLESRLFHPNADAIPPAGTAVDVIITPLAGAATAAARIVLDIDPLGGLFLDGQASRLDELVGRAQAYIRSHQQGEVVIRAAGEARVWDVEQARQELIFGGVREIQVERLSPQEFPMPRTGGQAADSLRWWRRELTDPQELIRPFQTAERALADVRRQREQLEVMRAIWRDYQDRLEQLLAERQAATQPTPEQPQP